MIVYICNPSTWEAGTVKFTRSRPALAKYLYLPLKKKKKKRKKRKTTTTKGQAPVAHTCNPTYSGGRDQKDKGSKPVRANSL
jgi:hypothetical protein